MQILPVQRNLQMGKNHVKKKCEIIHAEGIIKDDESPLSAAKKGDITSMWKSIESQKNIFVEVTMYSVEWKKSEHPESNQGPFDTCYFYSRTLYQLSYVRFRKYGIKPRGRGSRPKCVISQRKVDRDVI